MVQPCVDHQPGIDPEVGCPVPEKDGAMSVVELPRVQQRSNETKLRNGRQENLPVDFSREQGTSRTVVIHQLVAQRSTVVRQLSGGAQSQQVHGISDEKVEAEAESRETTVTKGLVQDSQVAETLVVFRETNICLTRRDMRLSIDQMVDTAMMLGVGILPRKVWDQQNLVHNESKEVIERLVGRESAFGIEETVRQQVYRRKHELNTHTPHRNTLGSYHVRIREQESRDQT